MKKNLVIAKVAAIAALNPSGSTVDAATSQPVTAGYFWLCCSTEAHTK